MELCIAAGPADGQNPRPLRADISGAQGHPMLLGELSANPSAHDNPVSKGKLKETDAPILHTHACQLTFSCPSA